MSITCPVCSMTSHHPMDVSEGYCGNCHAFTGKPCPLPPDAFDQSVEVCPVCGWPVANHPHQ